MRRPVMRRSTSAGSSAKCTTSGGLYPCCRSRTPRYCACATVRGNPSNTKPCEQSGRSMRSLIILSTRESGTRSPRSMMGLASFPSGVPLLTCSRSKGTPLGKEAKPIMERGDLVPDSLVLRMIRERIERPDCSHGFVFDGFPRTVAQAQYLGVLLRHHGYRPPLVVHFALDPALVLRRITGRRMCKVGGEIYNIYERPPKVEGRCDNDGGELEQRPDDREEIVGQRLQAYEKQTAPLVAYYRRLGRLHDVDASKSVEEVTQRVLEIVRGARQPAH